MSTATLPQPENSSSRSWGTVLKVIAALATALASALGLQGCL